MADESLEFEPVVDLANDYLKRLRRGERPTVDEYVAQYPDWEDQIREVFPMMLLMEDHVPEVGESDRSIDANPAMRLEKLGDYKILREIGRGGMGVVYEAIQESLGRHVALKVFPTHSHMNPRHQERFKRESRSAALLHHSNIVPVFGVGDDEGVLYYAMQFIRGAGLDEVIQELHRLRRSDKTKIPAGTCQLSQRGASEVALNLLSHPRQTNLVPPSDTAKPPDGPISSAVHLPGQSDDSTLSESGNQYWLSVARIGVQVADALAYAHGQGTLHRDIKPSNLLLDQNATVWVTDFGLAKSVEQDDLTHTGELVGTLRYMSPEQFSGKADARSDLYSLGLTLYELLVLRPAFDEPDRSRLVRAIAELEPPRPRRINSRIPRDLETIVLKAIAREPSERYQTADALTQDLARFLKNEPIEARRVSASERVTKWARRRPAVAGLSVALVLVFFSALSIVTWKWKDEQGARREAELAGIELKEERNQARIAEREERNAKIREATQRTRAEGLLDQTEASLYYSHIAQADLQYQLNNIPQAKMELRLAEPAPGETDLRGWEWRYLTGLIQTELKSLEAGTAEASWIKSIAFSADGTRFATGASAPIGFRNTRPGIQGIARVWDAKSGELIWELSDQALRSVQSVALSQDGALLATSDWDPTGGRYKVRVWNVESHNEMSTCPTGGVTYNLRFSPDSSLLAADVFRRVRVWDATTGKSQFTVNGNLFEFSDDGSRILVYGNTHGPMAEYDAHRGALISTGKLPTRGIRDPTGTYSAYIDGDRTVRVEAISSGELMHEFRHEGRIWDVSIRPDGSQLASAGGDGTVRLWDIVQGKPVAVFRGHTDHVISIAFSPAGDRLLSGDWDGSVKIWDVTRHPDHITVYPPNRGSSLVTDLVFEPNSELVTAAYQLSGERSYISSWNSVLGVGVEASPFLDLSNRLIAPGRHTELTADAQRLVGVTQKDPAVLKIWNAQTDIELHVLARHRHPVYHTVISANGQYAASVANPKPDAENRNSELIVWDAETGSSLIHSEQNASDYGVMAISPDARWLAVARNSTRLGNSHWPYSIDIWDLDSRKTVHQLNLHASVTALAFDRDETTLACADVQSLGFYDVASGELVQSSELTGVIEDLAFHPDGTRLAGSSRAHTMLWDTSTGHDVLTLKGPPRFADYAFAPRVTFSQDGKRLAASQWDGTVWIWAAEESNDEATKRRTNLANRRSGKLRRDQVSVSTKVRGWWHAALATLDDLIDQDPDDMELLKRRGIVHNKLGNDIQFREHYAQICTLRNIDENMVWITGAGDQIVAPHIPFHEFDEFTIETWVKDWLPAIRGGKSMLVYQGAAGESGVQFCADTGAFYSSTPGTAGYKYTGAHNFRFGLARPDTWTHLAIVFDGSNQMAFLNGKRTHMKPFQGLGSLNPLAPFIIGDSPLDIARLRGRGLLRTIRVSTSARYHDDFEPSEDLAQDDETVLLFDFSRKEGRRKGTHIPDLSGRGNHGELQNAWWN